MILFLAFLIATNYIVHLNHEIIQKYLLFSFVSKFIKSKNLCSKINCFKICQNSTIININNRPKLFNTFFYTLSNVSTSNF